MFRVIVGRMFKLIISFFFFQAEDGIRDLVRSRGLGDVYKRQKLHEIERATELGATEMDMVINLSALKNADWSYLAIELHAAAELTHQKPVSYTHLTLPTSDLV